MIPTSSGADASGIQSASFSAVLQEIYEQTQSEIQARNRNHSGQFGPSIQVNLQQPQVQDETYRFEPLLDPALSYISDILAEDGGDVGQPCLSSNEFAAYQAKAFEVAALLKEDSPALALKVEAKSPVSSGLGSSLSDDFDLEASSFLTTESFEGEQILHSGHPFSESWRNELLLHSLRGPLNRPLLQGQALRNPSESRQSGNPVWKENAQGQEVEMKPDAHKVQKSQKTGRVLKPRKDSATARKKSGGKARSNRDEDQDFVGINDLLLQSAQAIGVNNSKRALELLNKVRQHASPYGNGAQRLAYYFAEAMDARFSGTGWPLYLGSLRHRPSPAEILKATYMYMASCPFVKAYHYFINKTILDVAEGANKLHILELMVTGYQYPSLFQALANRKGGPPQVHLIAVNFPHYSMLHAQPEAVLEGVQKTCSQLADYAASCGVPFQYTAWAGKRDELQMQEFASPERPDGEVLVVISAYMLRYVMDDTLDSPIVRAKLLKQGRDINPNVYIQGIVTGSYSTPFFTRRFREALFHFESVFDMLDTFIQKDNSARMVFESEILGKAILNIVACEGTEVVDRVDKYKHWQAVTEEVGFKQLALNEDIKSNMQAMLKTWHKEYTVAEDSQYLLMGWKGRMLHAMSTWMASA